MLHRIVQTAAALLCILATATSRGAVEPANLPDHQILVLRNGQALEGRITQTERGYVVDLTDGQIRIKAADVDLICQNLEDGYRLKRSAIRVGNVHNHLELGQWCLRHGLLGPAGVELADAKAAEPNNPMVAVFEHRLQMAIEPPPAADSASPRKAGPGNDDLDRMVRSMPRGSVETFTQSIQPVLMNTCATAACHGPNSETGLRLFRVPTNKLASRRITQRNLYSVLQFVNRENPAESPLLTAPSGPHGDVKHAIFSEHQAAQYKRLVQWAGNLAQQTPSETSAGAMPASFDQPAGDPFDPEVFNRRHAPKNQEPPEKQ